MLPVGEYYLFCVGSLHAIASLLWLLCFSRYCGVKCQICLLLICFWQLIVMKGKEKKKSASKRTVSMRVCMNELPWMAEWDLGYFEWLNVYYTSRNFMLFFAILLLPKMPIVHVLFGALFYANSYALLIQWINSEQKKTSTWTLRQLISTHWRTTFRDGNSHNKSSIERDTTCMD